MNRTETQLVHGAGMDAASGERRHEMARSAPAVMPRCRSKIGWLVALWLALAAGSSDMTLWAQDAAAPAAAPAAATPPAKKRTEPRGRLPAYYGDLVDSKQRDEIYAIQTKHLAEIKKLRQQIAEIEATQEQEVEAVLTPEQRDKVRQLQEEAKSRRTASTKRKRMTEDPQE